MQLTPHRRFTLIELLVVVAIIAVLASLLLPALAKARALAKTTTCMSDKKNLYMATVMYTSDSDDALPNQGMSVAAFQASWSLARWGSEFMLQNVAPGNRYWGLGKLWPGGYLGDGRFLYCPDDRSERFVNGTSTGQVTGDYRKNFFKDGNYYLDHPTDFNRFPSHTAQSVYYVSPWYLSESGVTRSITARLADAVSINRRQPNWPLLVDGHFRGGAQWTDPVPHGGLGVTRAGNDGRVDFFRNPLGVATWDMGHPWETNHTLSRRVVSLMD